MAPFCSHLELFTGEGRAYNLWRTEKKFVFTSTFSWSSGQTGVRNADEILPSLKQGVIKASRNMRTDIVFIICVCCLLIILLLLLLSSYSKNLEHYIQPRGRKNDKVNMWETLPITCDCVWAPSVTGDSPCVNLTEALLVYFCIFILTCTQLFQYFCIFFFCNLGALHFWPSD